MSRIKTSLILATAVLLGVTLSGQARSDTSGRLVAGYVGIDEDGSRAVNAETYNLYEGFKLSLEDVRYTFDNGISARGDFRNITLDNRDLRASASKTRLFSLSLHDHQYRRRYDASGSANTVRESMGGAATLTPFTHLKLFGGFDRVTREGTDFFSFEPLAENASSMIDYTQDTYNVGADAYYRGSHLRVEYRASDFADDSPADTDRKGNNFSAYASSPVPRFKRVVLSSGYNHRVDELSSTAAAQLSASAPTGFELKSDLGWGAVRAILPEQFSLDYRIVFARTLHGGNNVETDNVFNTVAVTKRWARRGGIRVGYENRVADDLVDRTETDGFLANGWLNWNNRWFLKALAGSRSKDVVTGSTLLGNEDYTRFEGSARYRDDRWGAAGVRAASRQRENADLGSTADYAMAATNLNLNLSDYGTLSIEYAYYLGEYVNRSTTYEFFDNVVTGTLAPRSWRSVGAEVRGTYYRSRRDQNVEKFSLGFGVTYDMPEDFVLRADYTAFNYDDFQRLGRFYTGNVVEVTVARDFSL